jgi:hypothetical protein
MLNAAEQCLKRNPCKSSKKKKKKKIVWWGLAEM